MNPDHPFLGWTPLVSTHDPQQVAARCDEYPGHRLPSLEGGCGLVGGAPANEGFGEGEEIEIVQPPGSSADDPRRRTPFFMACINGYPPSGEVTTPIWGARGGEAAQGGSLHLDQGTKRPEDDRRR